VASFRPPRSPEDGYATPAALVLSLALAMVGSAMTARSVHTLRLSKAELERSRQELALDGAHLQAAASMIRSGMPGPYAWSLATDFGSMRVVAEAESDKLSPATAAEALDDDQLAALGVVDPAALRDRLAAIGPEPRDVDIAALDAAQPWRECAPSLISPLGRQDHFTYLARRSPGPGPNPSSWRVGEAWRVRIATSAGWRDDRIVRFTGDARHPVAVVVRRLARGQDRGDQCESLLTGLFGA
jgi:hypothetical protein